MDRFDFDVDDSLLRPLTARLASISPRGPTVRPIWYLWENQSFWWLTGPWSTLRTQLSGDARVALTIDICDLARGDVKQVLARGRAELQSYGAARAFRTLSRYLGADPTAWDRSRFDIAPPQPDTQFVRLHHFLSRRGRSHITVGCLGRGQQSTPDPSL